MTMPQENGKPQTPRRTRLVDSATGEVVAIGEMRMVPVSLLLKDPAYQRDTNLAWVKSAGSWSEAEASALVVSERGGILWIVDGGHRREVAVQNGIYKVWCFVVTGHTQAQEAALYVRLNKKRTALTSWAFWQASLTSGDGETGEIRTIVHKAGFDVGKNEGPRTIKAIDALRYIYRYGGPDLLTRTLDHVRRLWFEERGSLGRPMLKALALFIASAMTDPHFKPDRLERIMSDHSPSKLIRLGQAKADQRRASGVSPQDIALAIHAEYLRLTPKRETPLSPLKIGGKKATRRNVTKPGQG